MQFAGAGHPAAMHLSAADSRIRWLESRTTLVGFEHPLPVQCAMQASTIGPGDRILLYTDGLSEARNMRGMEFGRTAMADYVRAHDEQGSGIRTLLDCPCIQPGRTEG
jgi:serine phosphatase RsbU (regulator of sigma subunit)